MLGEVQTFLTSRRNFAVVWQGGLEFMKLFWLLTYSAFYYKAWWSISLTPSPLISLQIYIEILIDELQRKWEEHFSLTRSVTVIWLGINLKWWFEIVRKIVTSRCNCFLTIFSKICFKLLYMQIDFTIEIYDNNHEVLSAVRNSIDFRVTNYNLDWKSNLLQLYNFTNSSSASWDIYLSVLHIPPSETLEVMI